MNSTSELVNVRTSKADKTNGKSWEFTFDDDENIVSLKINGKVAKAGYMRGLRKACKTPYWILYPDDGVGRNPYSGVEINLDSLELSIYMWTLHWYSRYQRGGEKSTGVPIQTYDDMKYLLLEINPGAYMDLLD